MIYLTPAGDIPPLSIGRAAFSSVPAETMSHRPRRTPSQKSDTVILMGKNSVSEISVTLS